MAHPLSRRSFLATWAATPVVALAQDTRPTAANTLIQRAAATGEPLPAGEFWFQPPLKLVDPVCLSGTHGRTTLRALPGVRGPLIQVTTPLPGDVDLGLPKRGMIRDLRIVGNGHGAAEYGLVLGWTGTGNECAMLRVERVDIVHCYIGVVGAWAVDVAFRDSILSRNFCNIFLPGSGEATITTLRFSGCSIRLAGWAGALIRHGLSVTFDDRTIIEYNTGPGIVLEPGYNKIHDIMLRDVWLEGNGGGHVNDPGGLISMVNCWQG